MTASRFSRQTAAALRSSAVALALFAPTAVGAAEAEVDVGADYQPTFAKDVAPILQEKCQVCHQPDSVAPMALLTYEQSRPWARSIKRAVLSRQMPPWHIDKNVGIRKFKNDRSLSPEQIDTIVAWVDGDDLAPESPAVPFMTGANLATGIAQALAAREMAQPDAKVVGLLG